MPPIKQAELPQIKQDELPHIKQDELPRTASRIAASRIAYTKENVSPKEYKIHKYVYDLGIVNVPQIISYDKKTKQMKMVRIDAMNVSDFYGAEAENISEELFDTIRLVIQQLYDNNVLYIDITGYNFIEHDNKLWIIDFGDAMYNSKRKNKFLEKFLKGANEWNPAFL